MRSQLFAVVDIAPVNHQPGVHDFRKDGPVGQPELFPLRRHDQGIGTVRRVVDIGSVIDGIAQGAASSSMAAGSYARTATPAFSRARISVSEGASRTSSVSGLNESPQTATVLPFRFPSKWLLSLSNSTSFVGRSPPPPL